MMKRRLDDDTDETLQRNVKQKTEEKNPFEMMPVERFLGRNGYITAPTAQLYFTFDGDLERFKGLITDHVIDRNDVPLESDQRGFPNTTETMGSCASWDDWRGPVPDMHLFRLGVEHPFSEAIDNLRSASPRTVYLDAMTPLPLRGADQGWMVPLECSDEGWMARWHRNGCKLDSIRVHVPRPKIKQWTRDCIDAFKLDLAEDIHSIMYIHFTPLPLCKLMAEYVGIDYGSSPGALQQFVLLKNYLPMMRYGIEYAAWTNNLAAARVILDHTRHNHMTSTAMTIASYMGHRQFCRLGEEMKWTPPRNGGYWAVDKFAAKVEAMSPAECIQHAETIKKRCMVYFMHTISDGFSEAYVASLACNEHYLY